MKHEVIPIMAILLCGLSIFPSPAQAKYGGGSGTPEKPYLIYYDNQMNAIGADANDWDKCFKLMADIDLSEFDGKDGRPKFNIIGNAYLSPWDDHPFKGVFDGNHHTISNFTYTYTGTDYGIGLFGYVYSPNAEIKNLGLIDTNVDAGTGWFVGSLVGYLKDGTITECYVEGGSIAGGGSLYGGVGGLVGVNRDGTITNCYSSSDVSGNGRVGGLVGKNDYGTITKSRSTGNASGDDEIGGLVGVNWEGTITNCSSSAYVLGNKYVGDLVGWNREGTITDCYSTGSVSGDGDVGGMVGYNMFGTITNCYSSGSASGNWGVGGLVGENEEGTVSNSFWDIETSGLTTSDGGIGLTTAEMQMSSTFLQWGTCGNEGIWTIDEGKDYPRLAWENMPGEPINSYGGGTGDPNDPYLIYTAQQLNMIGLIPCDLDKHFKLMADIDLSAFNETSFNIIGTDWDNAFTGVFDGNGHTISNFTYTSTGTHHIGLFGYVRGSNAVIKELGLIDPDIDVGTGMDVGSLVGRLKDGKITGCYAVDGSVAGRFFFGGLVGVNDGTITNCYSSNSVSGIASVGGLVGRNLGTGTITNCYSTASVAGDGDVGGLAGINYGTITNCCSSGSILGKGWRVGGLVGENYGIITNCYSAGSVSGNTYVGGLAGLNNGIITNCYSTGSVTGDDCVGGLVGGNLDTISNCYSTGNVVGDEYVGGLVGQNVWCYSPGGCYEGEIWNSFWDISTSGQTTSDGGTGKTTAEMQTAATFVEWICEHVWTIDEGNDYPRLIWENMPGEPITTISYGGGSGEPNNPYLIYTAEQLNTIGLIPCHLGKHFKLMADIDLCGYTGASFNIIAEPYYGSEWLEHPFSGVFDGNGYTILNLTYHSNDKDFIGLFGFVDGGEIRNLGLIDPNVDVGTGEYVGALVGWLYRGNITDCYVEVGSVKGNSSIGGLVGIVGSLWGYGGNTGAMTNCYSTCTVSGYYGIGGLLGVNRGIITNCYSSRDVSGHQWVGGLTGENFGTISSCYSNCDVEGEDQIGGLVGGNGGTIANSYASGDVLANGAVGGLVGRNGWYFPMVAIDFGSISNCYSTGRIEGSPVGGLVGYNEYGEVMASFWDTETSGLNWSDGGTGKTTAEMQTMSTFADAGWGCELVWTIDEGNDYPRLWWENKPGEPIIKMSYCQGSGTEADPYLIYMSEQLNMIGLFSCDWDKHFKLMANIDLSGFTGTSFNIIGNKDYPFNGVFDGNGHAISSLTLNLSLSNYVGLFGYVGASGEIKNLGLVDANVSTDKGYIGGLVGYNEGTIRNSSVAGTVSGYTKVGGLVGYNYGGLLEQCYSSCLVSGSFDVGGLVGNTSQGIVVNCYAAESVSGYHNIGGLVGSNIRGMVTNCYASGSVSGSSGAGGLVGYNFSGSVIHSFWDIDSTGQTSSSGGGEGKSTVEMQMANTFFAWGICGSEGIWSIDDNNDYPYLAWELKPGQPIDNPDLSEILQGNGTKEKPYLIYTENDLNRIGQHFCELDKDFKLMADINLSSLTEGFNPIGTKLFPFGGIFDGSGHTISSFSVSGEFHIGLFGYVKGTTAEIRGLGLIQPEAYGKGEVGSLVGLFDSGSIKDCYAVDVNISGDFYIGGLVGLSSGRISNCYASGSVSGTSYRIGGLAGNNSGVIENCCATSSVISMIGSWGTGGLTGDNDGVISNCYAIGSVQGGDEVGGLVGENGYESSSGAKIYGHISNSYSTGEVSGASYVGGFVGHHEFGSVNDCFWDIQTSGLVTSDGGIGLPTAEMQMASTFIDVGWDFFGETFNGIEDIWFIPQQDYPHLWWEGMQVPLKLTPRTLNCRSKGNWVKAHLTLPEGFTVADVDSNRPAVLHSFGFESAPLYVFVNKNELVEIEAAFEREAVCSLAGDWPEVLTVAGFLADGNIFLGTSTVKIIHPGMKVIEELASCWLQGDCVHPTWCDGMDMNRDSLVNLLDYALLMNIKVEFVTDNENY
ncbi:MAG: GLUG motif-containing protein [Planctomycetota bacterium]|jgi:hypothetical protein